MVLILVPPTEHADRPGELCDYGNWRGRGWCRLEMVGAVLSRTSVRIMIVKSAVATPEFLAPLDTLQLLPGLGSYSCCAKNHDFGGGAGTSPCDLGAVTSVMSHMIDAKVEHLWSQRQVFDSRAFAGLKHWFMRGLHSRVTDHQATRGPAAARRILRWRSRDMEDEETRETGVGMLFWCALSNNIEGVRAAISQSYAREATPGSSFVGRKDVSIQNEVLLIDRPDLWSIFHIGTTPLHVAAGFASWEVVEAILDMGADPNARTKHDLPVFHLPALYGRAEVVRQWCKRMPEFDVDTGGLNLNLTALVACLQQGPDKAACVQALVEAGADVNQCADNGTHMLVALASNLDGDKAFSEMVLALPGVRDLVNKPIVPRTRMWKVRYNVARLLVWMVNRGVLPRTVSSWVRQSPLGSAARNGNHFVVKALIDAGANKASKNAQGKTPLDLASSIMHESTRALLRSGGQEVGSTGAQADAQAEGAKDGFVPDGMSSTELGAIGEYVENVKETPRGM